jgi:hypothetical protein
MMNRPRGATMAAISWVSTGSRPGLPVKVPNASPSQGCSPYALLRLWAPSPGMPRKIGAPALPDSIGMVRAMRWSKAPMTKAPLPNREHPVTPVASARRMLPFDCSMTSMIRLTPQAQAMSSPVLLDAP